MRKNRNIENSWGFNYSQFNSNGWSNLNLYEASRDPSILQPPPLNDLPIQPPLLVHQPPFPQPTSFLQCLEKDHSEQSDIKEVSYLVDNELETKKVNHKQYFRIMKRRVKKVMLKLTLNNGQENDPTNNQQKKQKYIYQSRHLHAKNRVRGKDGKFIATRSQQERFREKKKRGRKPKNSNPDINLSSTKHNFTSDKQPISI